MKAWFLLVKNFNDNVRILDKRVAYEFFASKLAPTKKHLWRSRRE
ncbi:hypothetical protein [Pseudomonas karstica]|nr:hypothetical protein [Pseudomonas karstica]